MFDEAPSDDAPRVCVMDTTLRDGEQTPGVAYSPAEKLALARVLLLEVRVDRLEIASAGVSPGEGEAVRGIASWARESRLLDRVEVLGFCDGARSATWAAELGAERMNLLTKGSEAHCRTQLRLTPEEHFASVRETVAAARARGVRVAGAYLEDWSRGIATSPDYVMTLTRTLLDAGVERLFLADTLGCLAPHDVGRHVETMRRAFPQAWFEFHGHDDYGLATANNLAAVSAGVRGVHVTVNGLGERAGNASLAETVATLHDHAGVCTGVNEAALNDAARLVESLSGKLLAASTPLVGTDVFTQTAGVHADGDRKGDLYTTRLTPARFRRQREYALGKHSGRASLQHHLDALGVTLTDKERDAVLARVVSDGERRRAVDLTAVIRDVTGGESLRGAL